MNRTDRLGRPTAVHTAGLGDRRVVVVVHPGVVLVRDATDGKEITRHRLPFRAEATVCVTHRNSALLVANSAEKVFVHDLGNARSEQIGSCASHISALTAGHLGGRLVVAAGDRQGSVGIFTLDDAQWSQKTVSAHQNTVHSVSLGRVRGRPSLVSCADDTTVTHTSIGRTTSRALWEIRWEEDRNSSTASSCAWYHHGKRFPHDRNKALRDALWHSQSRSADETLQRRMNTVQECAVVACGRTSFVIVTGMDSPAAMMSVGELPSRSGGPVSHTIAFAGPGRLAAVLPSRGGARLALVQGSTLRVTSVRVTRTWHWFHNALCVLAFGFMLAAIRADPELWSLLLLAVPMAFQVFRRPTVRAVTTRELVDIDLHGEIVDVDFDGPGALVALSHRGIAAFDLSEPEP